MKKRTAFLGAILSLLPLGQPLLIKTGVFLSTTGFIISVPRKVNAESADYYFNRAIDKGEKGDYNGAIADYTKALEINPKDSLAYANRGIAKYYLEKRNFIGYLFKGDLKSACDDWKKASYLGFDEASKWVKDDCGLTEIGKEEKKALEEKFSKVVIEELSPCNRAIGKEISLECFEHIEPIYKANKVRWFKVFTWAREQNIKEVVEFDKAVARGDEISYERLIPIIIEKYKAR